MSSIGSWVFAPSLLRYAFHTALRSPTAYNNLFLLPFRNTTDHPCTPRVSTPVICMRRTRPTVSDLYQSVSHYNVSTASQPTSLPPPLPPPMTTQIETATNFPLCPFIILHEFMIVWLYQTLLTQSCVICLLRFSIFYLPKK